MSLEKTDYVIVTKPTADGNEKQAYPVTHANVVIGLDEAIEKKLKELGVIK